MLQTLSKQTKDAISLLDLLACESRFLILNALIHARDEMCVGEISLATGLSQSATSHQLSILEHGDILVSHRMGKTICYEFANTPEARRAQEIIKISF